MSMNHNNILEIRGLEKKYRDFHLGPLDLSIPAGSIVGLIGENGAGKSTIIKSIAGLVRPDAGEIFFREKALSSKERSSFEEIGVCLPQLYLPQKMSVQQVGVFCSRLYRGWDQALFEKYITQFELSWWKKIFELSQGMKMKLYLTIALCHSPRLLVLDEVTSGLDPSAREEMLDALLSFLQDEKNSVLIASHILSDLEKAADYIAFIHEGELVFVEEKDALRERFALYYPRNGEKEALNPQAIVAGRKHAYGETLLVYRENMPPHIPLDRPSIEDVMLFYSKGERDESTHL